MLVLLYNYIYIQLSITIYKYFNYYKVAIKLLLVTNFYFILLFFFNYSINNMIFYYILFILVIYFIINSYFFINFLCSNYFFFFFIECLSYLQCAHILFIYYFLSFMLLSFLEIVRLANIFKKQLRASLIHTLFYFINYFSANHLATYTTLFINLYLYRKLFFINTNVQINKQSICTLLYNS